MHIATGLIIASITLFATFWSCRELHHGFSLRKNARGLESNDNEKLRKILMGQGEAKLCERLVIDISSWTPIAPTVGKIIGNGENSVIVIHPSPTGSIQLFEKLDNIEVSNIVVEIKPMSNNNVIYISHGLIKEVVRTTINGFHIIISDIANVQISPKEMSIFSNFIANSIINDVGISFNEINIQYFDDKNIQYFSFISTNIFSDNRVVYNGIYVKGKNIYIKSAKAPLYNGIMFGSISNIDFNYVVIDIENIKFDIRCEVHYGLFAYTIQQGITINNAMVIVRRGFRYEDFDEIKTSSYFSMIAIYVEMSMKINHCLIDIRFGDLILNFVPANWLGGNDILKRFLELSAVVDTAVSSLNLEANYLSVRYYYEKDCETKKKKCELFTGDNCKSMCEPCLIANSYTTGSVNLKNSYFNLDRSNGAAIEPYFIRTNKVGFLSDNSYATLNGNVFLFGTLSIISGDVISVYPPMMNVGYLKYGSIIYDSTLPYYDYNSNNINYELFENLKPKYDNMCVVTTAPDATNSTTVEESSSTTTEVDSTNEEKVTSSSSSSSSTTTTTTTPSHSITTPEETTTTTVIQPPPPTTIITTTTTTSSNDDDRTTTTTLTTATQIIDETVTTEIDRDATDEEIEKSHQSNKSKGMSTAALVSSTVVSSGALISIITGMVYYCKKHGVFAFGRRVSPESSVEMSIEDSNSEESTESRENLIGKV